jgi:energy-coupling factor transporter ATP-binding protein EcfA2
MLVAISGSQGSGKSTILRKLKEAGYPTIQRKTSRSILEDWGVTLQQVNNDPDLTIKFQEEITKRKAQDELEEREWNMSNASIHEPHQLVFTERTHADLFTYALVSLGKDNSYSDWLNQYYITCMEYCQVYDHVYYLRAGRFNIEHDGVRGANQHYSRMVDLTMLDTTQQMILSSKLTIIETPDLTQRVNMILTQMKAQCPAW